MLRDDQGRPVAIVAADGTRTLRSWDGDGLVRGVYSDANGEISSESLVGESPDVLPATREREL